MIAVFKGISATAYKTERSFNNQIVLNTPIEATFSSTNPFKCKNKHFTDYKH